MGGVHRWLDDLFKPSSVERTIDTLLAVQRGQSTQEVKRHHAQRRRRTARRHLDVLLDLAERGVADDALVQRINSAHAERVWTLIGQAALWSNLTDEAG